MRLFPCYASALDLKPDYAEAHLNLGILLNDQGKLDEAVAHYQRALALKPDPRRRRTIISALYSKTRESWT